MEDKPFTLWLTGLPCSGKTSIAKEISTILSKKGLSLIHLDGDSMRENISSDLGFSIEDRRENLNRISRVAELSNKDGKYVIASFVSPLKEHRDLLRKNITNIKIVHIDAPLEECINRDVKGMYSKALRGEIKDFTGISSPFENPKNPELIICTDKEAVSESVDKIYNKFFSGFF